MKGKDKQMIKVELDKNSGALRTVRKFFPNVRFVDDAKEKSIIEVTSRDAQSKAVRDYEACVFAVACKRKLKLDGVIISRSVAYMVKGETATRYFIPGSVAREIVSFDRGAGFETGTYELAAVGEKSRMGRKREDLSPDRERKNNNKRFRHITTNVRSVLGGERPEGE